MAESGSIPSRSSNPAAAGQLGLLFSEDSPPKTEPVRRIFAVAELVSVVRNHIEREFASVWVEGEVSNARPAPSGHLYFTLKDGEAQLPVVLFRKQALLLRFRPDNGLRVLVRGKVSVYEQRGQMQLVAETVEPMGVGSLQIAFEQLKVRLAEEGLFDADRKQPLPAYPKCVGIITSPSGAVIRDFLSVAARRHAALDILLFPAAVQGEAAALEIAAGIRFFNQVRNVDLIVVARGGGSMEDLAPFNSEALARAIGGSALPIVSAVGHETDFTIADFVADLRAPTPSAAAELITAAQHRVEDHVAELQHRLQRACRYQLMMASERLSRVSISAASARLRGALGQRQQRVDELDYRLEAAFTKFLKASAERLQTTSLKLSHQDPSRKVQQHLDQLRAMQTRLHHAVTIQLRQSASRYSQSAEKLRALSPLAVLGRGYAVVFSSEGTVVHSSSQVQPGDVLSTRLAAGSVTSTVLNREL